MIIKDLIFMSFTGSLAFICFHIICYIFKDIIGAEFKYMVLRLLLLCYLLPIHLIDITEFHFQDTTISTDLLISEELTTSLTTVSNIPYLITAGFYTLLLNIWGCGVAITTLLFILRLINTKIKLRNKTLISDNEIMRCRINEASNNMGLRNIPAVYYYPNINSPFVAGIFKPKLFLNNLEDPSLDLILEHELYHVKRNDLIFRYICQLVHCIFWFCPFIYFLKKDITTYCELSCDRKVLSHTTISEKKKYFRSVLYYATNKSIAQSHFCNFSTLERKSTLERRIENMFKTTSKPRIYKKIVAITCMITSLFGITLVSSAADSQVPVPLLEEEPDTLVPIPIETYMELGLDKDEISAEELEELLANGMDAQAALSIFGKSKTITKNYTSSSSVPASIYYTEYIDGAWWGGTLKLKSTEYLSSSKLYKATFSGTIKKQ